MNQEAKLVGLNPITGHAALNLTGGEQLIDESALEGVWADCTKQLSDELPAQQFNTWIRPLQAIEESGQLRLLAPNQFVKDFVSKEMLEEISKLIGGFSAQPISVEIEIGGGSVSQSTDGKIDGGIAVDIVIAVKGCVEPDPCAKREDHICLFDQFRGHQIAARPHLASV